MANIYIEPAKAKAMLSQQKALERALQELSRDVGSVHRGLNYKISGREAIDARLRDVVGQINREMDSTKALRTGLEQIINRYEQTENSNTERVKAEKTSVQNSDDLNNQILAIIKAILSWADKTESIDKAGLGKSEISYLESLYDFFTGDKRGLTGAEDWFDLGDKSVGLWTEYYDYLKDFYDGDGNAFSTKNQRKVKGIGIIGDVLGFISSAFGIADRISNTEDIGPAGTIGEILGGGDSIVDIWSGIEELKHAGDTVANITTKEGMYSPLTFYSAIAKSYISAFSQGFKSYEKYIADGVWDLSDTGKTGVEFAVAGLYSMVDSFSFGLISEETTGVSADSISEGIENWADNIGTRAGNYIVNDPVLYNAYNNSTSIMGRTVITLYAAFKSSCQ